VWDTLAYDAGDLLGASFADLIATTILDSDNFDRPAGGIFGAER
jgi:hypothetical protein